MKHITKLTLLAATFAVVGTGAALASDSQLQQRLAQQRQAAEREQRGTSVAVYADRQGTGRQTAMQQENRTEPRFEWRTPSRGQAYGIYVPAK